MLSNFLRRFNTETKALTAYTPPNILDEIWIARATLNPRDIPRKAAKSGSGETPGAGPGGLADEFQQAVSKCFHQMEEIIAMTSGGPWKAYDTQVEEAQRIAESLELAGSHLSTLTRGVVRKRSKCDPLLRELNHILLLTKPTTMPQAQADSAPEDSSYGQSYKEPSYDEEINDDAYAQAENETESNHGDEPKTGNGNIW
jgi:hypothetical protein